MSKYERCDRDTCQLAAGKTRFGKLEVAQTGQ